MKNDIYYSTCPHCGSNDTYCISQKEKPNLWGCRNCGRNFKELEQDDHGGWNARKQHIKNVRSASRKQSHVFDSKKARKKIRRIIGKYAIPYSKNGHGTYRFYKIHGDEKMRNLVTDLQKLFN